MTRPTTHSTARLLGLLLAVVAVMATTAAAPSDRQAAPKAPAAKVPLAIGVPHGYAGTEDFLKKVAAANPGITELVEIGKSVTGRPIHVLIVSNMKTGVTMDSLVTLKHPRTPPTNNMTPMKSYQGKPAQWIDGGTHGTEAAGTEACLYIIDKLVSGYGSNAAITKLVDDNTFYICPVVNPDASGAESKRAAQVDANGNFPEGWWKDNMTPGGSGAYPSSQPEAHAVLEFFTNHPNILLVESFDTTGGYSLRPFARWPEARVASRDIAVFDGVLGKKYLDLVGQTDPSRAWRSPYTKGPAAYGAFFDWAYGQFGAFAVATQLSDPQRDASGMSAEHLSAACEMAWQFEQYKASLLPRMAITNATAKVLYTTTQATHAVATRDGDAVTIKKSGLPAEASAKAGAYKVVQVTATLENTGGLPTQVASGPQLRGNREDAVWLLGDKITFLQGSRWQRLGVLDGTLQLPPAQAPAMGGGGRGGGGRGGGGAGAAPLAQMREQRPETPATRQTGSRRTVTWLVAVEGNTPLKIALTSLKGGTVVKDVQISGGL